MPHPIRVLLVDDEETLRVTVAANLEVAGGFEIVEAEDARRALEILDKDQRFDVVLTDIRMPGISGVELFLAIKKIKPDLPVVLMTAFAVEDQIREAIQGGAYAVLSKPFAVDDVVPMLARASQKPFVLVVEGTEADAAATASGLEQAGLRVLSVASGSAALDALAKNPIDVCIADPEVRTNGDAAVEAIRQRAPSVIILVLADTVTPEVAAKVAAVQPFAFLKNPMRAKDLITLVAKARATGS